MDTFTIEGVDKTKAALEALIAKVPQLVMDQVELYSEKVLSESKKEVPWDTTHLLQTGTVEPYDDGTTAGYQVGYYATAGDSDFNYGLRQHEDLTLQHPKPGTKAKFLEDPFNRIKGEVVEGIVRNVGRQL